MGAPPPMVAANPARLSPTLRPLISSIGSNPRFGIRLTPDHVGESAFNCIDAIRRELDEHDRDWCPRTLNGSHAAIANTLFTMLVADVDVIGDGAWQAINRAATALEDAAACKAVLDAEDMAAISNRQGLALAAVLHRHFEEMGQ